MPGPPVSTRIRDVAAASTAALIGPDWWHALGQSDDAALLADQQLGGGIAWGAGDIPALLIGLTLAQQLYFRRRISYDVV